MEVQLTEPSGVAATAQIEIIVTYSTNHRIKIFYQQLRFKCRFRALLCAAGAYRPRSEWWWFANRKISSSPSAHRHTRYKYSTSTDIMMKSNSVHVWDSDSSRQPNATIQRYIYESNEDAMV
ncbi:hypothetical protein HPB48_012518 [Haemaphysalis longicornis]|uniref:Uncharacterized protein n=1 Tax=Haemaphysalis longicornis TaxID=44386 RepID=A0A9J6GZY3_HAELO|nr:hypothetical protein HPB48_012518 [Haemaphysalis longicornis]